MPFSSASYAAVACAPAGNQADWRRRESSPGLRCRVAECLALIEVVARAGARSADSENKNIRHPIHTVLASHLCDDILQHPDDS